MEQAPNKTNGNAKSYLWAIIINADKKTLERGSIVEISQFFKRCENQLLSYNAFKFIATKIHDSDVLPNGQPKTIHLHAFIEISESVEQPTKTQLLNELVNLLDVSKNQISIDKTNNDFLMIQYLTHKNNPEKTQYNYAEIRTNNEQLLQERYYQIYRKKNDIQTDIMECKTISQLIDSQGVKLANQYRGLFNQVKKDQQQDYDSIVARYEKLWRAVNTIVEHTNELYEILDRQDFLTKVKINYDQMIKSWELIINEFYNKQ